jgi:GMP synthase (glutamine-hydrolysing)
LGRPENTVLVVDFGAQYAQLIARRVRECRVYSEIVPYNVTPEEIERRGAKALIFSGGPSSVYQEGAPKPNPGIMKMGLPILGICYGHQLMAQELGGVVEATGTREYGKTELELNGGGLLLAGLPVKQTVWMSHGDSVVGAPKGFKITGRTAASPAAAIEDVKRKLFGVQFHPEVIHTPLGKEVLKNFLYNAADCLPSWTMVSIIEQAAEEIQRVVGKNKIICGLSGGVDSATAAVLVHKAVGDQLTCVFVDHGLLRQGEAEQVEDTFRKHFRMNLIHVKAQERFLKRLEGVTDPEVKRKTIGEEFIRVFEEVAADLKDTDFLVQGTLYPDIIESGTREAARIKSHHNVGGLPEDMNFTLVEPLRNLFKDEVRAVGEELGLPEEIVWRQPFPGPGLAIRIIGDVTEEKLQMLRQADAVVIEEIKRAGLYREIWQSFAILPDIRTVGVMGDERTYAYPVAIRAVTSEDAMTADWARLPYEVMERISSRIINEVKGINRVVLDISSKPPATIEWE